MSDTKPTPAERRAALARRKNPRASKTWPLLLSASAGACVLIIALIVALGDPKPLGDYGAPDVELPIRDGDNEAELAELANAAAERSPEPEPRPVIPPPEWPVAQQFAQTDDLYALVQSLRAAAEAGDGEASWTLAEAFDHCELYVGKYAGVPDARRRFEQALVNMPPDLAQLRKTEFDRCTGFFDDRLALEDPLPWRALAMDAGHPSGILAGWTHAAIAPENTNPTLRDITEQVESQHPDVFRAAPLLLGLRDGPFGPPVGSEISLLSWKLLPCKLDQDCGPNSRRIAHECVWSACRERTSLPEQLRLTHDPFVYGEADVLADLLADAIRTRSLAESGLVSPQVPEHVRRHTAGDASGN